MRVGSDFSFGRLCIKVVLVAFNARYDDTDNKLAIPILQFQKAGKFYFSYKRRTHVNIYFTSIETLSIANSYHLSLSSTISFWFLSMDNIPSFKDIPF